VGRSQCIVPLWGTRRERNHWGDEGVECWIILGWFCGVRGFIGSWWGNRRVRDHWVDIGANVCIILGRICGKREVYRFMVAKTEGKRTLGRPGRRWLDNITIDVWEEGGI